MNASQPPVRDAAALIHPESVGADCLAVTTSAKVEQAIVAARFLDSLGIVAGSMRTTRLGRVECEIDRDDFDRARRVAVVEFGATVHHEPGGVFVEARIDGVPVQLWAGVA